MAKQSGFERRVRARIAKTGESYATARSRLLVMHRTLRRTTRGLTGCLRRSTSATATPPTCRGPGSRGAWAKGMTSRTRGRCRGRARRTAPDQGRLLRRLRGTPRAEGDRRAEVMRQFIERDRALEATATGEYVLWFEADLYNQPQLTEILARLACGIPAGRITLICIGEHAGIAASAAWGS